MYDRQPQLPTDGILGITPKSIPMPTFTKYIQKLRDCIRWAHRKANLFQQKEAWYHKQNYDKCNKAVSLRMGDTVLVHITTFKCRHKIQSRWGEQSVCGGMAALFKLTSICGMSHRQGRVQLYPTQKLPVAHQQ